MKVMLMTLAVALCTSSMAYAGDSILRDQFHQLDVNGDQRVSKVELRRQPELVRYTNLYPRDSFLFADVNEDGYLNEEEYVAHETLVLGY